MRDVVEICNPQEFWFMRFGDGYIVEDPDATDGGVRTYTNGDADWSLIAAVMTDISHQLMDAEGDHVSVEYEIPENAADQDVLRSWLRAGSPVTGDPGIDGDGRHRVWKALQARPGAILPVRSSLRSQARVLGRPGVEHINEVLSSVDEGVRVLNEKQMSWFESYRS